MSERAVADESRSSDSDTESTISVDNPVDVQRGHYARPCFYGDMSITSGYSTFSSAVGGATEYSGYVQNHEVKLTEDQYKRLTRIADSIARRFPINYTAIRDFLVILCCIDKYKHLRDIAHAVEMEELDNPILIGNPDAILDIPRLYRIAFVANAVDGVLKMYSRYTKLRNEVSSNPNHGISDILAGLSIGFGSAGTYRVESPTAADTMGNYLSELVTGQRIPMTVLAKNPNLAPPTYIGMTFCGESPHALSNVDVTQPFAKKIAAFPVPSNGSSSSMFPMMNAGSMQGSMSIGSVVASVMFGSSTVTPGSYKETAVNSVVLQLNVSTGVKPNETLEPSRADVAVPLLMGLSMSQSGVEKPLYGSNTFQEGWKMSCAISNHMMNTDPNFMLAYRSME